MASRAAAVGRQLTAIAALVLAITNAVNLPPTVRTALIAFAGAVASVEHWAAASNGTSTPPNGDNQSPPTLP